MKFKKLIKADFEDKFSNEWFDSYLQELIHWAENVIELRKQNKITLENKKKIESMVLDFLNKVHNNGD